MRTCFDGQAHTGINLVCTTCHKPTCQSRDSETGVGCTQDLGHEGKHFNYFSIHGMGRNADPWEDPDYVPVTPTEDEIEEAIDWQKDLDRLSAELLNDYYRGPEYG